MSVNPDLLRARCGEIQGSLTRLESFRAMSYEAFLHNQDALDVACYRLLIAIEASLALYDILQTGLDDLRPLNAAMAKLP